MQLFRAGILPGTGVDALVGLILAGNPMQTAFLKASLECMRKPELDSFEWFLGHSQRTGVTLDYIAESYNLFVRDTMKEQVYFARKRCYRHSTYKEVRDSVYLRDSYIRYA